VQPLAQRMLGDQRPELAHHLGVAAEGEVGLDPGLDGGLAQVLQSHAVSPSPPLSGQVGQGRAAPQAECRAQRRRRLRVLPGLQQPASRRRQELEPVGVHLVGLHIELVAGRPGDQRTCRHRPGRSRQRLAQVRHVPPQRGPGRLRRVALPQRVDDPGDRDDLTGAQQEQRQDGALSRPTEPYRRATHLDHERSEDAEADLFTRYVAHN
jgi:hypothetical protein